MSFLKKNKMLDTDAYASLMKGKSRSRQLHETLRTICKFRKSLKAFEGKVADGVFSLIHQLSNSSDSVIEHDFLIYNSTAYTSECHSTEKYVWGVILGIVFRSEALISPQFCQDLINDCLSNPTNMKFSLFHSDVIALAAKKYIEILDPSLIKLTIDTTDNSRAIYALKMANWMPRWSDISNTACKALLSECGPKRVEAMWLINQRGTCSEVVDFIRKCGFEAALPSAREAMDIKSLTAAAIKFQGHACSYVM